MFDRVLQPQEDQQGFAYFPFVVWLLLIFWLLPFPISIALWCGLQFLLLLCSPLVVSDALGWRIRPLALATLLLFSMLIYRYPMNAYVIGQFVPLSLACLVVGWWGLAYERPMVTSGALIMAMVRPEIVVLPVLFLLVAAWRMNFKHVLFTWGAGVALMWRATSVMIGLWEKDFITGLLSYREYSSPIWPPALPANWLLTVFVLGVITLWALWFYLGLAEFSQREALGWGVAASTLVGLVIFPQTGNYTLILALPAAWVVLWTLQDDRLGWPLVLLVLSLPWAFHSEVSAIVDWEHIIIPCVFLITLTLARIRRGKYISRSSSLSTLYRR